MNTRDGMTTERLYRHWGVGVRGEKAEAALVFRDVLHRVEWEAGEPDRIDGYAISWWNRVREGT